MRACLLAALGITGRGDGFPVRNQRRKWMLTKTSIVS
jgi:hypothetical protein